ncbi:riboflavin synthase subunit alpha [Pasteurellaceae bacterium 22721_9_1]
MLNPITEMKSQITTAKVLQRDLRATLKEKQKAVENFYVAKEKAEAIPPQPKPEPIKIDTPPPPKRIITDQTKEKALLKMAKEQYQNYADVAKFAETLNLRAGVVYLVLKHHGFIKQNETTQYRVLDAYYKYNGNLKAITEETGLTVWICARTLQELGLSPNWASYKNRAESTNKGDWAEEEFRRLVPGALDMNMQYQMNNPLFDFIVNDKTVDVKMSTVGKNKNSYQIRIRHTKDGELPDFFCLFLMIDKDKYNILLIPKEILPDNQTQLNIVSKGTPANSSMYWDFEVQPSALAAMLGDI